MTKKQVNDLLIDRIGQLAILPITCEEILQLAKAYAAITRNDDFVNIYKTIRSNNQNSCVPIQSDNDCSDIEDEC